MSAKILISGLANTGKTTLLQSLENVLVFAHDGKKYPFPQPHVNIEDFNNIAEFKELCNSKAVAYNEKFNTLPETVVFDSVSKIFQTIVANAKKNKKTGFEKWNFIDDEVTQFVNYIENDIVGQGINVVIVSHAQLNTETGIYELVAQGGFAKKGGFLSEVDNAVFVEVKGNTRKIHHKSPKYASRTILSDLPDIQDASEYNLQKHIDELVKVKDQVADYIL